jgi:hypothetical protein
MKYNIISEGLITVLLGIAILVPEATLVICPNNNELAFLIVIVLVRSGVISHPKVSVPVVRTAKPQAIERAVPLYGVPEAVSPAPQATASPLSPVNQIPRSLGPDPDTACKV